MSVCITAPQSVIQRNSAVTFTPDFAGPQHPGSSGFPSGNFGRKRGIPCFQRVVAIVRSTESGFATAAVKFFDACFLARKVAVVHLRSQHRAACTSRFTQTRRTSSKFRPSSHVPTRGFRPAVLSAAAAFSEVRYS